MPPQQLQSNFTFHCITNSSVCYDEGQAHGGINKSGMREWRFLPGNSGSWRTWRKTQCLTLFVSSFQGLFYSTTKSPFSQSKATLKGVIVWRMGWICSQYRKRRLGFHRERNLISSRETQWEACFEGTCNTFSFALTCKDDVLTEDKRFDLLLAALTRKKTPSEIKKNI